MSDRDFYAHLLSTTLATECHDRDDEAQHACDGSDEGTIKLDALHRVLASKSTVMKKRLTFVGYLKTVFILLKIALLHKMSHGKPPVIWLFTAQTLQPSIYCSPTARPPPATNSGKA